MTDRPPRTVEVAEITLSDYAVPAYGWRIVSDCGVVKAYSTRDGCMFALDPDSAREVAAEFTKAVNDAADLTELRSYGKTRL